MDSIGYTESTDFYEALCASLYAYHFGAIDFLELITHFEEMLGLHQSEGPDGDGISDEGKVSSAGVRPTSN